MIMPLQTTNYLPFIAPHKFSAYKVMQKVEDYYLVCPPNDEWNRTRYKLNELYKSEPVSYIILNEVGQGFFHTFLDLNKAKEYRDKMIRDWPNRQFVILNVIIPKDASYYVGRYTRYPDMLTYASNMIIYVSEV